MKNDIFYIYFFHDFTVGESEAKKRNIKNKYGYIFSTYIF